MNKRMHPIYAKAKVVFSPITWLLALVLLALNLSLSLVVEFLAIGDIHLLDVFTLIAACWLGALPGLFVGMVTCAILKFVIGTTIYYAFIPGFIVIIAVFIMRKGLFRKWWAYPCLVLVLALLWGFFGQVFVYFLNGQIIDVESSKMISYLVNEQHWRPFWAETIYTLVWELVDKSITVFILWLFFFLYPQEDKYLDFFPYTYLLKKPWSGPLPEQNALPNKKNSIKSRILGLTTGSYALLGVVVITILTSTNYNENYKNYCLALHGYSTAAAGVVNGDHLRSYFDSRSANEPFVDYDETSDELKTIANCDPRIKYVNVIRFHENYVEAVFDTDPETPYQLGEHVSYNEKLLPFVPNFLNGEDVEEVFRVNTAWGELLSTYSPIRDSTGTVVAYASVDFDSRSIYVATGITIAQVFSVECMTFVWGGIILYYLLTLGFIVPLQIMNDELNTYQQIGSKNWKGSKGDRDKIIWDDNNEIGELSHNIHKTEDEACTSLKEIEERTAKIISMEEGLVSALAEIVESRDVNTGDHIKRTSAYAKTLARALSKTEMFKDRISKDWISTLTVACTLHDVGKIGVSDVILNKPGKLTDEEFEIMKKHTLEGERLIEMAIKGVGDNAYLSLAKEIAGGHHEKWNGKGYPRALKGEDIPLSARIMAVVDVFDALSSKRSYKEPFSFEESINIIEEGRGEHFDPDIVDVFLENRHKFEKVYKKNKLN